MVRLLSGVELHLSAGAVLRASGNVADYAGRIVSSGQGDYWHRGEPAFHLLVAQDCEAVRLTGRGRLDGNGTAWYEPVEVGTEWPQPRTDIERMGAMVLFTGCRDVEIADVELGNVCNWTLHLHESDAIRVTGIRILNPAQAPNSDGIDITGCRNVIISGCQIDTGDDAICLKTLPDGRSCEQVIVQNCILRTHCVGLKLGSSESYQDMRQIVMSHCVVVGSHRAIGVYSNSGAVIEDVLFSHITMDTCSALMFTRPIHIELSDSGRPDKPGAIRNLQVTNLCGETNGRCLLVAQEGQCLEDIVLRDVVLRYPCFDDPALRGADFGGRQFASGNPWARTARAAFVGENIRGLVLDNVQGHLPDPVAVPAEDLPAKWAFAHKLANGTHRLFLPDEWTLQPGIDVDPFAWRNVTLRA